MHDSVRTFRRRVIPLLLRIRINRMMQGKTEGAISCVEEIWIDFAIHPVLGIASDSDCNGKATMFAIRDVSFNRKWNISVVSELQQWITITLAPVIITSISIVLNFPTRSKQATQQIQISSSILPNTVSPISNHLPKLRSTTGILLESSQLNASPSSFGNPIQLLLLILTAPGKKKKVRKYLLLFGSLRSVWNRCVSFQNVPSRLENELYRTEDSSTYQV